LWNGEKEIADRARSYFRLSFDLSAAVAAARLGLLFDDGGTVYVNGVLVEHQSRSDGVETVLERDLKANLRSGRNVLAIELENGSGPSGVVFYGEIRQANGKVVRLHSDTGVRSSATASEKWFLTDFDDSGWVAARDQGDAMSDPWREASWSQGGKLMLEFFTPEERARWDAELAKALEIPAAIAEEPEPKARIVYQGGLPYIDVNGRLFIPDLCLGEPLQPWMDTAVVHYRDLGVDLYDVGAWTFALESGTDGYDFSLFDGWIRRILHLNPNARFFVSLRMSCDRWCRAHPDEVVRYANGDILPGSGDHTGRPLRPSPASRAYREEVHRILKGFTDYVGKQPWRSRVIGVRPSWGVYGEWHMYGFWEGPDVSRPMADAFRRWQGGKYANEEPPTMAERSNGAFLLDPVRNRKAIDYFQCLQEEIADLALFMAHEVKTLLPGRLAGMYYGYVFAAFAPEGANVLLDRLLASPDVDYLSNPATYSAESRFAGGSYSHRTVPSAYRRYGKLCLLEDDTRHYHIRNFTRDEFLLHDAAESRAVMCRNYLSKLFDGCGIQFCDPIHARGLRPYLFDEPAVLDAFRDSRRAFHKALPLFPESGNDTAVVVDYRDRFVLDAHPRKGYDLFRRLYDEALERLCRSGVAFDVMTLQDYLQSGQDYKSVVFFNLYSTPMNERTAVKRKVRKSGMTAIWMIAPGAVTPDGFSDAAMSDLTGVTLKGAGIEPRLECADAEAKLAWEGKVIAKTLAEGGRSIVLPDLPKDGETWAKVLSAAGSHAYAKPGNCLRRHGGLLLYHVARAGEYALSLRPEERNDVYVELLSGKRLSGAEMRVSSDGPETWLFIRVAGE